jgi:putative ABC transport system ATP-binding protein
VTAVLDAAGVEHRWHAGLTVAIERLLLQPGEVVAVVGPSGCGKSTCLELLAFLLRPGRADRLTFAGADVAGLWRDGRTGELLRLRARAIGYVLQTGGLLPYLSARENAMLGRRLLGLAGPGDLDDLMAALGIADLGQRRPGQLSIGERQRVAVARALAHEPRLLLADEPTAALDPDQADRTMALLVDLARRKGCATVIVSHDRELVARAGCRVVACRVEGGRTLLSHGGEAA